MVNKYDQFNLSTSYMIRSIQEATIRISKLPDDKKSAFIQNNLYELRSMRAAVIERLQNMDRTKSDFFPVGCMVEYQYPAPGEPVKFATVLSRYGEDHLIIKLEGTESPPIKVEAVHLIIRFLRENK